MPECSAVGGRPSTCGWQVVSDPAGQWRYWDGRTWTAWAHVSGSGAPLRFSVKGWRPTWFNGIARIPVVFFPLAWFECSVPFTRGHLGRLLRPRELREFKSIRAEVAAGPTQRESARAQATSTLEPGSRGIGGRQLVGASTRHSGLTRDARQIHTSSNNQGVYSDKTVPPLAGDIAPPRVTSTTPLAPSSRCT